MTDDETRKSILLAQNLLDAREHLQIGCSDAQLRAVINTLREMPRFYPGLWNAVGLPGEPKIASQLWTGGFKQGERFTAVCMGGREKPMSKEVLEEYVRRSGVKLEPGQIVMPVDGPVSWTIWSDGSDGDRFLTTPDQPFKDHEFNVTDYFEAPAVVSESISIRRTSVIDYIGYMLGAIHLQPKQYLKESGEMGALEELRAVKLSPRVTKRDLPHFIFLAIAQEAISSNDVSRYIQRVREMNAE